MAVGRPKKEPGEALVEVPCKVPLEVADEIARLSTVMDRSRSQIARKFIMRGLADYKRDGLLEDPEPKSSTVRHSSGPTQKRRRITDDRGEIFARNGEPMTENDEQTILRDMEQEEEEKRRKGTPEE
jgi:hypothetical protein